MSVGAGVSPSICKDRLVIKYMNSRLCFCISVRENAMIYLLRVVFSEYLNQRERSNV